MNSISTYNTYLSTHQLSQYSASSIGWIFSIYIFLTFLCGIFIGPVFDAKGPRLLVFAGSVLMMASIMLMGICTGTRDSHLLRPDKDLCLPSGLEYWQFLIVFGILGGVGTSLIVTPATTAIGHFFMIKRGYATGIACTGGSVGGVILPLMLEALFSKGWAWATRIQGFVFLVLLALANLLIRVRLESIANTKLFPLPNVRIFRQPAFVIVTVAAYFLEWGLFVPVTYLTSYCVDSGAFSPTFAYQVIAIYNGASTVGRWVSGYLADRFGAYNIMIIMVFCCTSTSLGLWLPAAVFSDDILSAGSTNHSSAISALTISYAVLMGIASGSNISLAPVCVSKLCDTRQYGEYYGMCYTIVAFGTLTGVPIAGAIIGTGRAYWAGALFCGLCYLCALIGFVAIRITKAGWTWTVRY
jgi:MFS family permease